MNKFPIVLFLLTFFSFFSSAREFACEMPTLSSFSQPWSESDSFITLNFQGTLAAQLFHGMGETDANFFSVIVHKGWCKALTDTIMCETPTSALVDVESSQGPNGPKKVSSLRYFLTVLNYRNDGWAFLKIRGKRLDELPPINLNTELPAGSCRIFEE